VSRFGNFCRSIERTSDKVHFQKGPPFKAFLVVKGPKVEFEFEERKPGRKAGEKDDAPKEPVAKLDFTGQEPWASVPSAEAMFLKRMRLFFVKNHRPNAGLASSRLAK
jgi:hypothetical protein